MLVTYGDTKYGFGSLYEDNDIILFYASYNMYFEYAQIGNKVFKGEDGERRFYQTLNGEGRSKMIKVKAFLLSTIDWCAMGAYKVTDEQVDKLVNRFLE